MLLPADKEGTMIQQSYTSSYHASWALVIGINAYQHAQPLAYACNDADAVATALTIDLGFPAGNVLLLKDSQATKNAILEAYLGFINKAADPDDRVLVFFAGHGMTAQGHRESVGFLVPVDGNPSNKNSLIRWDELTRYADLIAAKHVLFIMDACYSGLALQRAVPPGTERFLSDMLQRFARQVITAGKANETVADGGGPTGKNSIFTGYLLEGLNGRAADMNGVLTANSLMHYVYQKVSQDHRSQQSPHYGHFDGDGDFVLRSPNNEHLTPTPAADYLVPSVEEIPEVAPAAAEPTKPSFLIRSGYANPEHPSFGRNIWSKYLAELHIGHDLLREIVPATSWLALIAEPAAEHHLSIEIDAQAKQLPNKIYASVNPSEQFRMPSTAITTVDSLVLYDLDYESQRWTRYLRIEESGNLEYTESWRPFLQLDQIRFFRYVQTIGTTWQFLFLVKHVLDAAGYTGGVKVTFSLVGTRDSVLMDFSQSPGEGNQRWVDPASPDARFLGVDPRMLTCHSANLQMSYQVVLAKLDEAESFRIIKDIAAKLGRAYNHQSPPRCFNFGTEIFPWNQFDFIR
jgi:hypothetical protein